MVFSLTWFPSLGKELDYDEKRIQKKPPDEASDGVSVNQFGSRILIFAGVGVVVIFPSSHRTIEVE